jgi:two-component system, NarL family, sensor kinase
MLELINMRKRHIMKPISNSLFFSQLSPSARWGIIIVAFILIALFDFLTPAQYILEYLYVIPILVSVSFLRPTIAKRLSYLSVAATLADSYFPRMVLSELPIVIDRLLAALSIIISTYFMVRYTRYQAQILEQEKLVETERNLAKMREDFVATLTHDLKTPLLGEQRVLHHFLEGTFGAVEPEQRTTLEALNRNKNRQLELVDNLLSVYRNDNVGVELRSSSIDMDELIADVLTDVQELAQERQLSLTYQCKRVPPKVKGDALQLRRVLSNVLHNALNYTPLNGHIDVALSELGSFLRIDISDDGPGLAQDELESVFQRFYRAEGQRDTIGTGLGLYLSRQLIQAHRGRLWAENKPEGGCRFSFLLPINSE